MALLVCLVVLGPSVYSRLASPWRCVVIYSSEGQGTAASTADRPVVGLRVACFNIAHGRGLATSNLSGGSREQRRARLDDIAALLRSMDADVVVLNEVDFDCSWSYSVNQADYLAEKAGYPYRVEQRNVDVRLLVWTWRYGNAVLSRFPIDDARLVDLPGYSVGEAVLVGKKRGVVCDVAVGGQTVRVIGVHLSHRSEAVRVRSAEVLANMAAEGQLPTIVAGDLNSTPPGFPGSDVDRTGRNAVAVLDASGQFRRLPEDRPPGADDLTFPADEPRILIDWILIPRQWNFTQYWVRQTELSDHRPVGAEVIMEAAQ